MLEKEATDSTMLQADFVLWLFFITHIYLDEYVSFAWNLLLKDCFNILSKTLKKCQLCLHEKHEFVNFLKLESGLSP